MTGRNQQVIRGRLQIVPNQPFHGTTIRALRGSCPVNSNR